MASIDLIVLGILYQEPLSAYDIQKLVEYRKISQWVKISTPSIYKKVIQLQEKGLITGESTKEGNFAQKTVYSLTPEGKAQFEKLMVQISSEPINMYLDYNAVVVNLMNISPDKRQVCVANIEANLGAIKKELKENMERKEQRPDVPALGMAVLHQQYALAEALEKWLQSLKNQIDG